MHKRITVYDNYISARTYISYIAEQAGGFAYVGRDGKLYIKEIGKDEVEIPIELFSEYKYGEEFKISKVSYEDGIRSFKFGDKTRNTLWINQENMFIVDEEQVENIYNQVKDLTMNSFEGTTIIDPAIDIGDKVIIRDKVVIYQGEMTLQGKFIANISSKIQSKSQEETTARIPSQTAINRRLQSEINQEELRITQLAQEQTEQSQKLTQHEQTIDSISSKVEDIEDLTQTVDGIKYLSLSKCIEGDLLELHIYGNNTVFDYLYCSDDLYCSNDLYCRGDSRIVVLSYVMSQNGNVTEEIDKEETYELGITDVLRQNGDVCDEFILKDGQAKVIRRINKDGSIKETEEVEDLGELKIDLSSEYNEIYIKNYTAKIKARYAVKNEFTNTFATKIEMNTAIKQTAEKIETEVSKKVDEEEFGTRVIQDFESVQIAWNRISEFIKYINGEMRIYDSNSNILMVLNKNGQSFYNFGEYVGHIGTNQLASDNSKKSLDFDLGAEGSFMTWASKASADAPNYMKWTYSKGDIPEFPKEGLYAGIDIYTQLHRIFLNSQTYIQDCSINHSMNGNNGFWIVIDGNYKLNINDDGIYVNGEVYETGLSSDGRLKENIKASSINAIDIIKQMKVRSFDWKKDKKHINAGYIAQEMEKIDENFVLKRAIKSEQGEVIDYEYYMNELPIIATLTKAIQEQQEEIEKLKSIIEIQNTNIEKISQKLEIDIEKTVETVKRTTKRKEEIKQYNETIKKIEHKAKNTPLKIKMINDNKGSIKLEKEEK